jgi:hypothetical protein
MKIKTYKVNPKLQFTGFFTFKPCGCTAGYGFGFNTRKRGISIQIRVRKGCGNWPERDILFRHCL